MEIYLVFGVATMILTPIVWVIYEIIEGVVGATRTPMATVIGDLRVNLTAATAEFGRRLKKARSTLDQFRRTGQARAAGGASLAGVSRIFIG